jgi:hypothetical protein
MPFVVMAVVDAIILGNVFFYLSPSAWTLRERKRVRLAWRRQRRLRYLQQELRKQQELQRTMRQEGCGNGEEGGCKEEGGRVWEWLEEEKGSDGGTLETTR